MYETFLIKEKYENVGNISIEKYLYTKRCFNENFKIQYKCAISKQAVVCVITRQQIVSQVSET